MKTVNDILNHNENVAFESVISDSHNETVNTLKEIIKPNATINQLKELIVKFDEHRCFQWLEDHAIDVMGEDEYFEFLEDSGIE